MFTNLGQEPDKISLSAAVASFLVAITPLVVKIIKDKIRRKRKREAIRQHLRCLGMLENQTKGE